MPTEVVVRPPVPLPERLDPPVMRNTLMSSVRPYFYKLYNDEEGFRGYLAAVNNATAITGNRFFDRYEAVRMIQDLAVQDRNQVVLNAKAGDLYRCICYLMRQHELGLRARLQAWRRLTTTAE